MTSRGRRAALAVAAWVSIVAASCGDGPARPDAAGPVRLRTIVTRASPQHAAQHLVVARVDLADPRVSVAVLPAGPDPDGPGPWECTLALPTVVARANDLALTVNGGFFLHEIGGGAADGGAAGGMAKYSVGDPGRAAGLCVVDGRGNGVGGWPGVLWFDAAGHAAITPTKDVPAPDPSGDPPPDANGSGDGHGKGGGPGVRQAVAGSYVVLQDGRNVAPDDGGRHPRTLAGLTKDRRTLVLIVADGKRPGWADGLTLGELAEAARDEGCDVALNLDGGGSSAMVRRTPLAGPADPDGRPPRWDLVSTPSDGATFVLPLSVQRPVAYVLGVRVAR